MEVKGYVVKFCCKTNCIHQNSNSCTNAINSKFYIDPQNSLNTIKGVSLVVAHNDNHIIGTCVSEKHVLGEGIFIKCIIDDLYLLDAIKRQWAIYKQKYNKTISKITFWKKVLSSFSLSHSPDTGNVQHVSLVDSPGRIGTAVTYKELEHSKSIVLKRRNENKYISDVISTQTAAAISASDRQQYLLKNTKYSYNPDDVLYITASREMATPQERFDKRFLTLAVKRTIKELQKDRHNNNYFYPSDSDDSENEQRVQNKKRRRDRRELEEYRERDLPKIEAQRDVSETKPQSDKWDLVMNQMNCFSDVLTKILGATQSSMINVNPNKTTPPQIPTPSTTSTPQPISKPEMVVDTIVDKPQVSFPGSSSITTLQTPAQEVQASRGRPATLSVELTREDLIRAVNLIHGED